MNRLKLIAIVILCFFALALIMLLAGIHIREERLKYEYNLQKEIIENDIKTDSIKSEINKQEVLIDSIKLNADERIKEIINADGSTTVNIFKELVAGD